MCNAYRLITPAYQLFDLFNEIGLALRPAEPAPLSNAPLEMIRPTNRAPIARPLDPLNSSAGVELVAVRWGLIPWFHKGGIKDWKFLCTNVRSETIDTARPFRDAFKARRCIVPADGFFEWTGPKGGKTKWLFTRTDGALMGFPGLWERWESPDGPLETFTLATTAAGPDAEPYHDRQPVILNADQWASWLDLTMDAKALLQASPPGTLNVERA